MLHFLKFNLPFWWNDYKTTLSFKSPMINNKIFYSHQHYYFHLQLISELNHEIAKMRCLAQGVGRQADSSKDDQKLRHNLVQARQRCWELCKHVRDNIVPRLERWWCFLLLFQKTKLLFLPEFLCIGVESFAGPIYF